MRLRIDGHSNQLDQPVALERFLDDGNARAGSPSGQRWRHMPAEYLYKLVSGTVRTSKILNDGRRQIGAFYLPGDIFGFEVSNEHGLSAEAITDAKVIVIKRSAVDALAARDSDIARQLWAMTGRELQRMQEHLLLLIKSAQERVAGFDGLAVPAIKAKDPVGFRDRVPAFDIGELASIGLARADVPAVEAPPQRLQLFC
jgi:CRP-like cAMP-binding protein